MRVRVTLLAPSRMLDCASVSAGECVRVLDASDKLGGGVT